MSSSKPTIKAKGMSWESEDMQVLAALLELRMPTLQFPAQSLRCAHHFGDSIDTLATRAMTCHLPGVSHQSTRPPGGGGWQLFGQCHSVRPRRELERRLLVESSQGPPLSPKRGLVHGRPGISQRDWGAERVQPIHPTFLLGQKFSESIPRPPSRHLTRETNCHLGAFLEGKRSHWVLRVHTLTRSRPHVNIRDPATSSRSTTASRSCPLGKLKAHTKNQSSKCSRSRAAATGKQRTPSSTTSCLSLRRIKSTRRPSLCRPKGFQRGMPMEVLSPKLKSLRT